MKRLKYTYFLVDIHNKYFDELGLKRNSRMQLPRSKLNKAYSSQKQLLWAISYTLLQLQMLRPNLLTKKQFNNFVRIRSPVHLIVAKILGKKQVTRYICKEDSPKINKKVKHVNKKKVRYKVLLVASLLVISYYQHIASINFSIYLANSSPSHWKLGSLEQVTYSRSYALALHKIKTGNISKIHPSNITSYEQKI